VANGKSGSIKVLSIDGGGIRGIIPAVILSAIQKQLGRDLHTYFDLIAGTSTGGIIALGIGTACNNGKPYSPDELLNLYVRNGPAIFKQDMLTPEKQLFFPKYAPDGLEAALAGFFKDAELKAALTPLLISSYDLQSQLPFFFKSHRIATDGSYNWPLAAVARATAAAPTYFPPHHLTRGSEDYALVDGGVFVNNPSMAAYAEARALYGGFEEFVVVSAGTGNRQDRITYSAAKEWGMIGWARQIAPVLMDSVSEAVDYEMRQIPGCSYYRLQIPNLQLAEADMDNASPQNMENLQATANEYVASASNELAQVCAELAKGRGCDMPGIGKP
jgi:patatin-like phospholipase/acyl hydrolase